MRQKILGGASLALGLSALIANAHVRQRSFYQYDSDDIADGGIEAIIRWTSANVTVRMHKFSGCLGSGSTISFDGSHVDCAGDAHSLMGDSLAQWFDPLLAGIGDRFGGVVPGLGLVLDNNDKPILTTAGCEFKANGSADGMNNIVFTTKIDPACSSSIDIPAYEGVIGLTRVRYALDDGRIVESDIQFNDADYKFTVAGSNNLGAGEINLKDVAVHELGHFFGLDHSASRTSTMLFAVSDGMHDTSSDDIAGMWSLYQNQDSQIGSLKGSLTLNGAPVFGGVVSVYDARKLGLVASEMSNLDGNFEFCGLPAGNYVAVATPYRPASTNIHDYYSGFGGYAPTDGGLCANPGCKRMNTAIKHSWHTVGVSDSADFGKTLKTFSVAGGTSNRYLNIKATTTVTALGSPWEAVASNDNEAVLELDEPRVMRFRDGFVIHPGSSAPLDGKNDFLITTASSRLDVRIAALGIYSRMNAAVELLDSDTNVAPGAGTCTTTAGLVAEGKDLRVACTGLSPSTSYKLRITGTAVPCDKVPGNAAACSAVSDEIASSNIPYYLISAYDPTALEPTVSAAALESSGLGGSAYADLPSCSSTVAKRETSEPASCCGSLGGGGIDPTVSLWLALLMSPLTWALMAIAIERWLRRRRLV